MTFISCHPLFNSSSQEAEAEGFLSIRNNSSKGRKENTAALALQQPPQVDQQGGDWVMGYVVSCPED